MTHQAAPPRQFPNLAAAQRLSILDRPRPWLDSASVRHMEALGNPITRPTCRW
jgi:hypothetical protein